MVDSPKRRQDCEIRTLQRKTRPLCFVAEYCAHLLKTGFVLESKIDVKSLFKKMFQQWF